MNKDRELYLQAAEDIHIKKACELFAVKPEDVTPKMRRIAKELNFSISYGSFTGRLSSIPAKSIDELIEEELL